jgi:thermostable 8-oxoguanine DNA glycosylase
MLREARFDPRRADGRQRRYRFPNRKAALISAARRWVLGNSPLLERLESIPSDRERREFMCGCPGMGPKTASWFLRNLGLGRDLAIIDVHVMRVLLSSGRLNYAQAPYTYEIAEQAFLDWCRELGAAPPAFDLFVWEWERGSLWAK